MTWPIFGEFALVFLFGVCRIVFVAVFVCLLVEFVLLRV